MLRRRIIWMTGQWINVKVSRLTRPLVYQVALKLMNAQEDLVVGNRQIKGLLQEGRKLLFWPKVRNTYNLPSFRKIQ